MSGTEIAYDTMVMCGTEIAYATTRPQLEEELAEVASPYPPTLPYAMSGSGIAYGGIVLCALYTVCGIA
eukprot:1312971-Rhodomonas_salina.1